MRRLCVPLLFALALAGCTRSPADQLKDELRNVASWAATVRAVGDAWRRGAEPDAYVTKTLDNAEQALRDEAKTIQGLKPDGVADVQASAFNETQSVAQLSGQMRAAVLKRDGQALAGLLEQVRAAEQKLRDAARGLGAAQP